MPINLGNPTWLNIVADGGTPPDVAVYAGIRIPIPEGVALPPQGKQDTLTISGVTVHGYVREGPSGTEWMLTPAVDPNVAALDVIPGLAGWTSAPSRAVYASVGSNLLGLGVSGADVRAGLKLLYDAAVANHVAANGG